jgi:hypothetical protein
VLQQQSPSIGYRPPSDIPLLTTERFGQRGGDVQIELAVSFAFDTLQGCGVAHNADI